MALTTLPGEEGARSLPVPTEVGVLRETEEEEEEGVVQEGEEEEGVVQEEEEEEVAGEDEEEEEEEEQDEGAEGTLRHQMMLLGIKESRLPLESTVCGTCWLAYVRRRQLKAMGRASGKEDAGCRILYQRSESQREKENREKEGVSLAAMKVWPNWVKNSRICAGLLQKMEKEGKGPSMKINEEFPGAGIQDLPAICRRLLDIASQTGLGKETVTNFKKWLSE